MNPLPTMIWLLLSASAPTDSAQLIATIALGTSGGGTADATKPYTDVRTVSIELGYTGELFGATCSSPRVGCVPIPVESLVSGAVFDYDAASPNFAAVTQMMVNGVDDQISEVNRLLDGSSQLMFGSGAGNTESAWLRGTPDLQGFRIERLRLRVNAFTLTWYCCPGNTGLQYDVDYQWEVYGRALPVPVRRATWGRLKARYR